MEDWRAFFRKAGKKYLQLVILHALTQKPAHGYELLKIVEEKTGGWRPSHSLLYPLLKSLKDSGYIESRAEVKGCGKQRIVYFITDKGKNLLAKVREEFLRFLSCITDILLSAEKPHPGVGFLVALLSTDYGKKLLRDLDSKKRRVLLENARKILEEQLKFIEEQLGKE